MIIRRAFVATLLVAGVASFAVVGPTAAGPDTHPSGPPAGQESEGALVAKTRTAPAGSETEVAARLATGASAWVPISAYRMYDSRNDLAGKFVVGETAAIDALTDENLNPMVPATATGVTFNVTVSQTEGAGFVQISGPGVAAFSTSTVNWMAADVDIANSGSSELGSVLAPGDLNIALGGSPQAKAHVIIDITGYYEPINP